jgi:hypothetical protein
MPFITGIVVPFLVYWLILFAACYMIVEYGQGYLYDEATPGAGLKITLGSMLLAALLTWTRSSYESMFTEDLPKTLFQAIIWFIVFTLVFRFHPQHAFAIGVVAMVILAGGSTLAVNSMSGNHPAGVAANREPSKPLRKSVAPQAPITPAHEPEKKPAAAKP